MKIKNDLVPVEVMQVAIAHGFDWECDHEEDGVPLASYGYLERWFREVLNYNVRIKYKRIWRWSTNKSSGWQSSTTDGYLAHEIQKDNHTVTYGRKQFPTFEEAQIEGWRRIFDIIDEEKKKSEV